MEPSELIKTLAYAFASLAGAGILLAIIAVDWQSYSKNEKSIAGKLGFGRDGGIASHIKEPYVRIIKLYRFAALLVFLLLVGALIVSKG